MPLIFLLGIIFGISLTMGEVISWFRIQEMFLFDSFHMYGVIGSAIGLGIAFNVLARARKWSAYGGKPLDIHRYEAGWKRYLFGGALFGMGWAITGACPGPLFIALGAGYTPVLVAILGGLLGTILYGVFLRKLPH